MDLNADRIEAWIKAHPEEFGGMVEAGRLKVAGRWTRVPFVRQIPDQGDRWARYAMVADNGMLQVAYASAEPQLHGSPRTWDFWTKASGLGPGGYHSAQEAMFAADCSLDAAGWVIVHGYDHRPDQL